jgi:Uma2 family endonuclease
MAMPLRLPHYTIDQLAHFPADGQRYELLEGFLLVTPAPGAPHQLIASRLQVALATYLGKRAFVTGPGVIEREPDTHLEPDILVFPGPIHPGVGWQDFTSHWLAVEVLSRGSRRYDRDYKRDAYLALGVLEVWLVDPAERSVLVSRAGVDERRVTGLLRWTAPEADQPLELSVEGLFAEL